jgi:hypothetical protein
MCVLLIVGLWAVVVLFRSGGLPEIWSLPPVWGLPPGLLLPGLIVFAAVFQVLVGATVVAVLVTATEKWVLRRAVRLGGKAA